MIDARKIMKLRHDTLSDYISFWKLVWIGKVPKTLLFGWELDVSEKSFHGFSSFFPNLSIIFSGPLPVYHDSLFHYLVVLADTVLVPRMIDYFPVNESNTLYVF